MERDPRVERGGQCPPTLGCARSQTAGAVWHDASNADARHRNSLDRALPALDNSDIQDSLEFVVQAEKPLRPYFSYCSMNVPPLAVVGPP